MRVLLTLSLLGLLAVAGCQSTPVLLPPEGHTQLQMDTDLVECRLVAAGLGPRVAPVVPHIPPSMPAADSQTAAAQGLAQGLGTAASWMTLAHFAKAKREREHAVRTCLKLRGYVEEE